MALKLNSLKANIDREKTGDWVSYPELGDKDVAFKVRGINYPEFQAKRDREGKRLASRYGTEEIPQDEFDKVQGRLLAEEILLDWKGLDEPYSADLAMNCLSDPAYRELRMAVVACAIRLTQVKVEFTEAAVKNSAPPSGKN